MATPVFDTTAPRKPANLSVNSDLMLKAKERAINVSALLEVALTEEIRRRERAEWQEANRTAIDDYNRKIQESGLFSDGLRTF